MLCSVIIKQEYVLKSVGGSTLLTHPCNAAPWGKVKRKLLAFLKFGISSVVSFIQSAQSMHICYIHPVL